MTRIAGSIALVTGGASGIGRLVALRLADQGATVVLWDLDAERLTPVLAELESRTGRQAHGYGCDVADRTMVAEVAERVRAEVGDVDILVNNAGIVSGRPLLEIPDEKIEATFAVNTLALYWTTKAFLPAMLRNDRGHLATIASAAGLVGVARQTDYSASKHAAVGFDESLRVELAQQGSAVRTTVVCPFYIDTGMFDGVKTRVPWLLPILDPDKVADKIVRAIERDRAQLVMPPTVRTLAPMRILPARLFDKMMDLFGVNVSMEDFTGRTAGGAPTGEHHDRGAEARTAKS
jgi:all-trans-retinol dehydrogenase (NAD+)